MSRLFFYIALSLALHFFAVLPLLQQQFATAFAAATPTLERKALALPKLAVKPAGKPVASVVTQAAKAPVVETKNASQNSTCAERNCRLKQWLALQKTAGSMLPRQRFKQQSPALQESKSSSAGETRRASEKPLITEKLSSRLKQSCQ